MGAKLEPTRYKSLLEDVQALLRKTRCQVYQAVDNIRVQTYWQIRERITREELKQRERAVYSKRIVERLAKDIGFTRAVLYRVIQFYKTYPIVVTLSRQLSWSHYEILITITPKEKRQFYEQQAIQNNWSIRDFKKQLKKRFFERRDKPRLESPGLLMPVKAISPEGVFRNNYSFDFLELSGNYDEQKLEKSLLQNVEKLLLELGTGFSISGRQKKMIIDGQIHTVDLEFFHRGIPCVVLVDLKIGKFKSEYVGQMNKYLNFYKENKRYPWEKDPIGLIICEDKGRDEVYYALGGLVNYIFVAEYRVKLPKEKEIIEKLRKFKI